jgi:hypothetical protein
MTIVAIVFLLAMGLSVVALAAAGIVIAVRRETGSARTRPRTIGTSARGSTGSRARMTDPASRQGVSAVRATGPWPLDDLL